MRRSAVVMALATTVLALSGCGPAAGRVATAVASSPASPSASLPAPATTAPVNPAPTPSRRSTPPRTPTARPSSRSATTITRLRYAFPIRGCHTSYARVHHDYPATDIWAARGCAFVSPATGVVDEVSYVDRWNPSTDLGAYRGGLSVSVIGVDGVRYYGSHLSSIASGIRPGAHVVAGQLLGRVGATGDAVRVGPHLHFGISWPTAHGIWWVRRGEVYPWPYLDSWRAGGSMSPVSAVRHKEAALGRTPSCTAEC